MNIGFYLLDVDTQNQEHQTILNSINQLCSNRPYDNIVLFNNKFNALDVDHKYYILHISEAKYFKGILFVFDIKSAMLTKTFPAPKKQILHVGKPTWTEKNNIPYKFWHDIYMDDNFELITDNRDMYELCDTCWKTPIANVLNFQPKDIENVIQKL
jgi:hypothetical protein|tara:strand:+ start:2059 stop:2526 length:468 start_codon:yes stop_codon:yes gene_type:complete